MKQITKTMVYKEWGLGTTYKRGNSSYVLWDPLRICLSHSEVSHLNPYTCLSIHCDDPDLRPATKEDFERIGVVWHPDYGG